MKVALWAEIRRLSEIEKLSGRMIARRLHCSRHTVAAALSMQQPPSGTAARRASLLDRYLDQIKDLLAKYPDLSAERIREEIAHGPQGYTGSTTVLRRYLRKIRPARGRVYQEVPYQPGQAMQIDWGECGRVQVGSTTRKVSVLVAVLCYSRLLYLEFTLSQRKAEFYRGLVNALTDFRWQSAPADLRQPQGGRAQRLRTQRLFPSRVAGAVRLFLSAANRLRAARSGIERSCRGRCALRQAQRLGGPGR